MRRSRRLGAALALELTALVAVVAIAPVAGAGTERAFVVLYKKQAVPSGAATTVAKAGGTLVTSYPQIGVVIAKSSNDAFRTNLMKDTRVQGASATDAFGVKIAPSYDEEGALEAVDPATVTSSPTWGDPLSGLQWDMVQIHVPEAYAVNPGSPSVLVGDIDTGLDFTHPDLAPNYDAANSADCTSGCRRRSRPATM